MISIVVKIFIIFVLSVSGPFAKEVSSSFNFIVNDLLPKGVFTFGFNRGSTFTTDHRYSNTGSRISNRQWNSRNLKFKDIVDSAQSVNDLVLSAAAFKAFGIELKSRAGFIENDLAIKSSSEVFMLGYGLNKNSNLFLIIPRVSININITSKLKPSNEYEQLITNLYESGQSLRANYLEQIKNDPLKTRLTENGQNTFTNIDTISNIYLNYRYKLNSILLDSFVVVPYGYKYQTSDLVDFRLNDNSLGVKQGLGYNLQITQKSSLQLYGSYHYRSSFTTDYRIPRLENDPLSSDIERDVKIKYGDTVDSSVQYRFDWNSIIKSYLNLRYQYSFKDKFQGRRFSQNRYDFLANETNSESLSGHLGLAINTITPFLANKFLLPMDINVQYSKTLYAKNSFDTDLIALNLMVFYK